VSRPLRLLRVGRWAATCVLWAGVGLVAGLIAAVVLPAFAGWRSLTVMSGSMEPTIGTGDVIVTRPIAPLSARVGDVVTFHDPARDGRLVTHRVRRIQVTGKSVQFETKGDANNSPEQWAVPVGGRIGRVEYHMPRFGYLLHWVSSPSVRRALVTVPTVLLGAWILFRLWRPRGRTPAGR
jgi:signal peptidase